MQILLPNPPKVLPCLVVIFCSLLTFSFVMGQVQLVKDIQPGPGSSYVNVFTDNAPTLQVNGTLYFSADDGQHGVELWKTNGTPAGTVLVKDINPGRNSSNPDLALYNGALYFTADDGQHGVELWKTDGTTDGTVLVKDINVGHSGSMYSLTGAQVLNGTLYFSANDGGAIRLWKSDGTVGGTALVSNTGGLSHHFQLTKVNNTLFFVFDDGTHGEELWKSDGTTTGTAIVKDIFPGSFNSQPQSLINVNGTLFFTAGIHGDGTSSLWKSDGTESGTVLVFDNGLNPYLAEMISFNNLLYFFRGPALWRSDGTTAGTSLVKGFGANTILSKKWIYQDKLYFGADLYGQPTNLWKSDGTLAGTTLATALQGTLERFQTAAGKLCVFSTDPDTGDPFLTVSSTGDEFTALSGSYTNVTGIGDTLYLLKYDLTSTALIYSISKSDGKQVAPLVSGLTDVSQLLALQSSLLFWSSDQAAGKELRKLNPAAPILAAPTITNLNPTRNAISAPRTTNVSVTFSQPVNAASASGAAIKIRGSQTGTRTLTGKGTFSGSGTSTVTFDPSADFKPGEKVQLSITTNVRNTGGTPLAKPQVVNFTAATAAAPLAFVPVSGQPAHTYDQEAADFDGDGDVDIAAGSVASALWLNDGSGHFSTSKSLGLDTVWLLKAADLDGDGDVDLAAVVNTTAITLRFNDGRGNFSGNVSLDLGDPIHSLEVGDFDGDGDVDLAGLTSKDYNGTEGGLSVRFNNGSGQFSGIGRLFVGLNPHEIHAADFDNDGDLDIACSNDNDGLSGEANRLYLAFNDGTGQFTSKADAYFNNQVVTSFGVGDLDHDGDMDLATNQDEGDVYNVFGTIYTNNGSGSFKVGQVIGGTAGRVHLGDMDGDGDLDLLTTAYRPGSSFGLTLRLNNGSGVFATSPIPLLSGTSGYGLSLADLDGDGTLDIANFPYVALNNSGCSTTGSIRREYWANLPGNSITSIPVNAPPTTVSQLASLRTPANIADNYGQRLRGYLCAPTTGNYTFFIQGDDQVELYLSSDVTAAHKQRIAWANVAWSWTAKASQQSAPIRLVAGQRYYLEVLHKEASGLDQVVVGWLTPDMAASAAPVVIPGSVLSPAPAPNVVAPVDFMDIAVPSSDEMLLTWYENNSEETGYVVERATSQEGPYLTVGTLGPQLYKYVDFQDTVGLQPNTTYFYRVYATSLLGPSPYSQLLSGTTEPCQATGTILREYWANFPGRNIADIPFNTPPTSSSQLTILRTAAGMGDNYGQRIRGYLCAPATGNFTFFIQGDDNAELYLSPDKDPAHKRLIASAKLAWSWTDNASQQSSPISLVAGRSYYLEVLHKEASGGDQVRVGWRTPAMAADAEPVIIPGSVLSPVVVPTSARVASPELGPVEVVADELTAAPNPFSEQTTIRFTTVATEQSRLQVYDVQGRVVGQLFEGLSQAWEVHQVSFDASHLSQGMYVVRLATARKVSHQKLLLAR